MTSGVSTDSGKSTRYWVMHALKQDIWFQLSYIGSSVDTVILLLLVPFISRHFFSRQFLLIFLIFLQLLLHLLNLRFLQDISFLLGPLLLSFVLECRKSIIKHNGSINLCVSFIFCAFGNSEEGDAIHMVRSVNLCLDVQEWV